MRLPIYCRKKTGRTCAGTVKLRTVGRITPNSRARQGAKRRVTFITFEYQLAQGKTGYAIARLSEEKLDLMKQLKKVKVDRLGPGHRLAAATARRSSRTVAFKTAQHVLVAR